MRIVITCLLLLLITPTFGQDDYRIKDAKSVKVGYQVYPFDIATEELDWSSVLSRCVTDAQFGNWFEVKVKSDRIKFSVHTGPRLGDLENPIMYLGEVIETATSRELKELNCVKHFGSEGVFSIEATNLDPNKRYFLLLVAEEAGRRYAIETTDNFSPMMAMKPVTAPKYSIFGRILTKSGKMQMGVTVTLLDENEKKIASAITDEKGAFKFEELPKQDVFMTRIEEDDTEMLVEMFLIDEKGSIKSRATRIADRLYAFGANLEGFRQLNLLTPREYAMNTEEGKVGMVGRIVDNQSFLFGRSNVKVGLYSKSKSLLASATTNESGMFKFENLDKDDYAVQIEGGERNRDFIEIVMIDDLDVPYEYSNSTMLGKNGFFSFEKLPKDLVEMARLEALDTKLKTKDNFSKLEKGQSIVLRNILFESGSANLLEASFIELDALARGLKSNPEVKIEVQGHTDNTGNSASNMSLSSKRAQAVADYLISKEIDTERLTFKGYGQTVPIASNDTPEGREKNRRVEFKVLD